MSAWHPATAWLAIPLALGLAGCDPQQTFTPPGAAGPAGAGYRSPFLSEVGYPLAGSSQALVAVDLDGDGHADLAATSNASKVSVLLNRGDGTFLPRQDYATAASATQIVSGDFNGDGHPDLALIDAGGIGVLINDGTGTFAAKVTYAVAAGAGWIASADLNGDGNSDLIVSSSTAGVMSVLLANADGTFQAPVTYATGATPYQLTLGDFNADGRIDVAVACLGGDVDVFLGAGDGTFAAAVPYAMGGGAAGIAAIDLNGDGHVDLVVSVYDHYEIRTLFGRGDGTFRITPTFYPEPLLSVFLYAADLSGHGPPTLFIVEPYIQSIGLFTPAPDGLSFARTDYAIGKQPTGAAVADVNGDGAPDLLATDVVQALVWVRLHR